MSGNGKVFFGGMPIKPDVDRLLSVFSKITHGDVIKHEDVARVIGQPYKSNRYRGVVAAWINSVRTQTAMQIVGEFGVGFRVLTHDEASKRGDKYLKHIRRTAYKGSVLNDAVDTNQLSEQGKSQHQIRRRHLHLLADMAQTARREVSFSAPGAHKSLPRPQSR